MSFDSEIPLPNFPLETLPSVLKDYTVAAAECLQVPNDMAASVILGVIALASQKKVEIHPKPGWIEPLNLYMLVVASPSERKSSALKACISPIIAYEEKENERLKPLIQEYNLTKDTLEKELESMKKRYANGKPDVTRADLTNKQKELNDLTPYYPIRLYADDATPEALVRLMKQNNGSIGLLSTEGGIFDIAAGRYSKNSDVNIDVFLKAYSGDDIRVNRMTREQEDVKNPALTMALTVQPTVLNNLLSNPDLRGRGFVQRFLYSVPKTIIGSRNYKVEMIPDEVQSKYDKLVWELLQMQPETPITLELSEEADHLAEAFFDELEPKLQTSLKPIEGWAGKLHGNTMRIAGVLHCAEYGESCGSHLVSGTVMKNAISIARYYLEHAKEAFGSRGMMDDTPTKNAKYILERMDKRGLTKITKRDLQKSCQAIKSKVELEEALDVLIRRGYVKIVKEYVSPLLEAVSSCDDPWTWPVDIPPSAEAEDEWNSRNEKYFSSAESQDKNTNGRGRPSEYVILNPIYLKQRDESVA